MTAVCLQFETITGYENLYGYLETLAAAPPGSCRVSRHCCCANEYSNLLSRIGVPRV